MKKLLIIGGAIIVLFAAIIMLTQMSNNSKLQQHNPYGTNNLQQATIDQLDDPNYQNIILPDDLTSQIKSGKPVTAYLFSPLCEHCKNMTPKLMSLAQKRGIEINQLNILEFEDAWTTYSVEATPTLIHFKDGKEVNRLVGDAPEDVIESFFNDVVLK